MTKYRDNGQKAPVFLENGHLARKTARSSKNIKPETSSQSTLRKDLRNPGEEIEHDYLGQKNLCLMEGSASYL